MSTIDNRIVKMGFDNAQFTSAANATMGTLKKLSDSLRLTEGAKGLENIAGKVKKVDMTGLASGVESVTSRFSAMDVIGVTALANIANSAVNAGKQLISSLTVDPIKLGFDEYETKMNAITTIMTNTAHAGTTMDQVTATLGELNEYADKTIYNFAEMTRNIGTFTAAGIGLEDSAIAIKGIANLAAASGSSSQQASTAMYQLSQALASGTVKLQDWNSVVNAGMGGKLFQDALEETAKKLGKGRDMSVSFRDSLQDGWLTSEVLIETLKDFSIDETMLNAATQVKTFTQLLDTMKESVQSGWAQSWELIIGDKDEATAFFTSISDGFNNIMGPMADYRNEALGFWSENGGREALINGLSNAASIFGKVLGPVYEAFKKIIDPWNGERLVSLSKGFENLTKKLIPSDKASQAIGKTFEALFSIVKLILTPLKLVGGIFNALITIAKPFVDLFVRIIGVFGGLSSKATEAVQSTGWLQVALDWLAKGAEKVANVLTTVFNNFGDVFEKVVAKGASFVGALSEKFSELVSIGRDKIGQVSAYVAEWVSIHKPIEKVSGFIKMALDNTRQAFETFTTFMGGVWDGIKSGISSFVDFCKNSINTIQDFFTSIVDKVKNSGIQGIDLVNAGLFATAIVVIKKVVGFIKDVLISFADFKSGAIDVMDEVKGALETYQKDLKGDLLQKVAIGIAILAGSLFLLSKIDPSRLIPATVAMGVAVTSLIIATKQFDDIDPKDLKESASMLLTLIGISTALNILATAMLKLAKLDWDEILKAIVGMAAACAAVYALTKSLDKANLNPGQGVALMLMATSLIILSGAMAIIGNLDIDTLQKSLLSLGAIVLGVSVFLNSLRGVSNAVNVGASLIPISLSMIVFAGALALFGNMDTNTIIQGMTTLGMTLTLLSGFANSMRGIQTNLAAAGLGMLLLSNAMIILSGAIAIFGNMEIETLAKGLVTMALALGMITAAFKMMPKGVIGMATGILILGVAMTVFGGALAILGNLEWETIGKGLLALAGVFAAVGVAAVLMTPVMPILGGLALAMLGIGAAAGLVGGGLMLLSTGITMFAGAIMAAGGSILAILGGIAIAIPVFAASIALAFVSFITIIGYNATALGRAMTQLLTAFLQTIIDNIPLAVEAITLFIMQILQSIIAMAPVIAETLITLVTSLKEVFVSLVTNILQTLIETVPLLIQTLTIILLSALEAIRQIIPQIVSVIMEIFVSIMNTLATNLPLIANAVLNFIVSLTVTVLSNLASAIPQISAQIVSIIVAIINSIAEGVPRVVNACWDFVISMINGFTNTIQTKMPEVRQAVKGLVKAIIEEFKNAIKDAVSVGGDIVSGMANGIKNGISKVTEAAKNVAKSALNAAKNLLGINSPSRAFFEVGKWSDEGMVEGLAKYSGKVEGEAVGVADGALSGMKSVMSNIGSIINADVNSQPVIKPVMDLTDIQNGANSISGMMNDNYRIGANVDSVNTAANSMNSRMVNNIDPNTVNPTTNNNTNTISNTFNITGTNAREIADEISRIIQKQVERREVVWA